MTIVCGKCGIKFVHANDFCAHGCAIAQQVKKEAAS